ncbi:DUF4386 domain-containing protein [Nocardioides aestuarii]|uniref:DUF4386 domain-containing protein n=1 Tax=Nocardioides aestuarii TaxID=252231 RepID=A0ABW4TKQ3_9ACTN
MSTQTTQAARTAPRTGSPDVLRRVAGWAAAGYVAIFVLAIFGNFLALDPTIHPGEPGATADALREAGTTFRLGIAAFLGIFLADVVVAWALYELFAPVGRSLSLLAAWFRLTYTVVLGAAMGLLYVAVSLAERGTSAGDEGVLLALQAFDFTWVVGLAAFGAHLLLVARLLVAAAGPRWLAAVMTLAGAAYVVDTVAHIVLADYEAWAGGFLLMVALPSVVGELAFTIWLAMVARGRRSIAAG